MSNNASSFSKPRYIEDQDMSAAVVGDWLSIRGVSNVGFQFAWEATAARPVVVTNTDSVVAGTKTWTFANGAFATTEVGGTFTITGTDLGNDGTYTIASRTSATVVVSVEAPAADETFDGTETMSVQIADAVGEWVAEVSYDGPNLRGDAPEERLGPTELTLPTSITDMNPNGTPGNGELVFTAQTANWFRLSYQPTSGGGNLNVGSAGKSY
jgi:hypothetical protein